MLKDQMMLEDLGAPVHNATIHGAVYTKDEAGRWIAYLAIDGSTGEAARLGILDIERERMIQTIELPGASGCFTIALAADQSVYLGAHNNGEIYRYLPATHTLQRLGRPTPETSFNYAFVARSDGSIMGGTYPGAVFHTYHPHEGFKLIGSQPFVQGEQYVRSLAHLEAHEVTYVGMGSHPCIRRLDHRTGVVKELLPDRYREEDEFVYHMQIREGKLFVRLHPSNRMLIYALHEGKDGQIEETLEQEISGYSGFGVTPVVDGKVFYPNAGWLMSYELADGKVASLDVDTGIMIMHMDVLTLGEQHGNARQMIVGVGIRMGRTRLFKYDLQSGEYTFTDLDIEGIATNIQSVVTAADGRLYIGAFLVGGIAVFDPARDEFAEYKGVGQTENFAELNGKLYLSAYPSAKLFEYDPAQPWTRADGGDNPRMLFDLGAEGQDRPYGLVAGGGKLYIGTICGYGKLGGAIVSYDPVQQERKVYRNPLPDLSIVALVYRDGKLYGGTNVWGGLGIRPKAVEAQLLIFDIETETARGIPLPVPHLKAITALIWGQEGLLWGMAEGYLFSYDSHTSDFKTMVQLFPHINYAQGSIWRDASLLFGDDGMLYGTIQGTSFFRFDTARQSFELLVSNGARFLAKDHQGRLYFSDNETRLHRFTIEKMN